MRQGADRNGALSGSNANQIIQGERKMDTPDRATYTAGLRALADILDNHPCLAAPVDGRLAPMTIYVGGEEQLTAAAHAIGGDWEPGWSQTANGILFHLEGEVEGLRVVISTYLDAPMTPAQARPELAGAA